MRLPWPEPGLILTLEAQGYLRESGKWATFLGIVGFVFTAFILLGALFVGTIMSLMTRLQPASMPYPAAVGGLLSFVYILVAIFYFFFSLYLFQFGSRIKKGILFNNPTEVGSALGKLKSFFKMWGITTIVILALYALIIIVAIIVGVGASMMHR